MQLIFGKPANNGEVLVNTYRGAVQAYAEENYARGAAPGKAFDQGTAAMAKRLGMTFDPISRTYSPAKVGEPAYAEFARRIQADPQLAAQLPPGGDAVAWFRSQTPDTAAINRIVAQP
jgi:hypothetical protein